MSTQIKLDGVWVTVAGGHRMWVGTKAARDAALAAGKIPDGTSVMTTDDYTPPTPPGDIYVISASRAELVRVSDTRYKCDKSFPTPLPAGLYHVEVRAQGDANTSLTNTRCYMYGIVNSIGQQMVGSTLWSLMIKYSDPVSTVSFDVASPSNDGVTCGFANIVYKFTKIA